MSKKKPKTSPLLVSTFRQGRTRFLNVGGWIYGSLGLATLLAGLIAWGCWAFGAWESVPERLPTHALFLGIVGTGLTIAGIGLAIHDAIRTKPASEELRIADDIREKLDEMTKTIESLRLELRKHPKQQAHVINKENSARRRRQGKK